MTRFTTIAAVSTALFLGALSAPRTAGAAVVPTPSATDPRIRVVRYEPNQVVLLEGTMGYAMTIEFDQGERIENVSIGDSLGWQVTPNRRANLLFLKPVDKVGTTNMSVVTNLRSYNFDLRVRRARGAGDTGAIFGLHFDYPEPVRLVASIDPATKPAPPPPPTDVNHAYSFEGSSKGLPSRVFDDGQSTYFEFPAATDVPAIFAVDNDKKEAVVNVTFRNGMFVVDRLARAFVLRRGTEISRIINDGFREEASTTGLAPHKGRKGPVR